MPDTRPDTRLTLDLALTIRHDGQGGVADDLDATEGLTRWVRVHPDTLGGVPDGHWQADAVTLAAVRSLRAAVRALFAHAVRPGEPSPADARRLLSVTEALERLNAAAAAVPTVAVLAWPEGGEPMAADRPATAAGPEAVAATLARAAIGFLAGPDRSSLRACHAPRCVRYFLKEHPRQEWCKPSCGNRARVARHHERHRVPQP
ncbi:CGNR zinc finger domain-containing protein [Streptomyces sp. NPDC057136]|uniref:CGNR zinc finger domain-containing protein n=1 Tax=Streptomyces sp. NPDC057136 TaxID=3346029 RepID=UPI00362D4BA8